MSEPTTLDDQVVVRLRNVRKKFVLRHTRSLKEATVWLLTGRKGDLAKKFDALENVSLDVRSGDSVALLGLNGSGKSTTLKIISGVMTPDEGTVGVRGRLAGLIEVGAGFHVDLPGRENVYLNAAILGMTKEQIDARFDDIVEFSEIGDFIDTEVKFYSSGMYLRLAFSVAVHTEPDIFMVDEILAVGDEPFQRKCIHRIKDLVARNKTLIVVSHDLELVQEICTRGIVMEEGRKVFDGTCRDAVNFLRAAER